MQRLLVGVLVALLVVVAIPAAPAQEQGLSRDRLAGPDRYATAAAVSAKAFPGQRPVALLARGDLFADALAASALAGALEAPVLLSRRDRVPDVTMAELDRLTASEVVLLGGAGALAPAVEDQLRAAGFAVDRIGGATRTATAARLARRLAQEQGVGLVEGRPTAFLTTAADFPDALAAGPLAYAARLPILLAERDSLPPDTADAVRDLGIEQVVVLGGEHAVSRRTELALGVATQRLQGADRTLTAAAVAAFAVSALSFGNAEIVLARGDAFPDALVSAPYAGSRKSPLLLTSGPRSLGPGARNHLANAGLAVRSLTSLGGPAALSEHTVDAAEGTVLGITYAFPVQPSTAASYGRSHHDYPATDIFAACGTTVVAPVRGRVDEVSLTDRWDPDVNEGATRGGLSVSIVGDDGVRYYGSHFATIGAAIRPGVRVQAGQTLGTVGRTGSARATPCHLHFGLSPPCGPGDWEVRRGVIHPWPYLDAWKSGQDLSPVSEVRAWAAAHASACRQE